MAALECRLIGPSLFSRRRNTFHWETRGIRTGPGAWLEGRFSCSCLPAPNMQRRRCAPSRLKKQKKDCRRGSSR